MHTAWRLVAIFLIALLPPKNQTAKQARQRLRRQRLVSHLHCLGPSPPAKSPGAPPDSRTRGIAIWSESRHPHGTLVDAYLGSRGLELPDEAANEAIRFHPDCPFGLKRFPAMVCLARNVITIEPQAVHRTALAPDGPAIERDGKTFRLSLGPVAGGAIKIDADEDVMQGICIGEGVETCLSGRQMGLRLVWSLVNSGGIANFPILPGIEGLDIFAENDANGRARASRRDEPAASCAGPPKDRAACRPSVWRLGCPSHVPAGPISPRSRR